MNWFIDHVLPLINFSLLLVGAWILRRRRNFWELEMDALAERMKTEIPLAVINGLMSQMDVKSLETRVQNVESQADYLERRMNKEPTDGGPEA